ncbi:MAG TPA: hypothetical protein VMH02_05405, partial [Verrucomicrobiae bacterium]|nr:hypothetical protein [Verrucomicrobiae bacterium]
LQASLDGTNTIPLRATVRVGPQERSIEKQVSVTVSPGQDPMHLEHPWNVSWTPSGGGPYPDFEGHLTVRADEDYKTCILELEGTYTPPLGAVGAAFDAMIGSRIASATARELLQRFGAMMVEQYVKNEAGKHA